MNGTEVKNQLIFEYASGSLGLSKSIFASTYLYLNSKAAKVNETFEHLLGEDLLNNQDIQPKKLTYSDCIKNELPQTKREDTSNTSPLNKFLGPFENLKWKQIYKGFKQFVPDIDASEDPFPKVCEPVIANWEFVYACLLASPISRITIFSLLKLTAAPSKTSEAPSKNASTDSDSSLIT